MGQQLDIKNNELYHGHFENGLKNGKGRLEKGNLEIKEGTWLNNKFHGVGRYIVFSKN